MIGKALRRIKSAVTHSKADREFIEEMRKALADGSLTDEERYYLQERHAELGAGGVWHELGEDLFAAAVRGAIRHGEISPARSAEVLQIRDYLRLTEEQAAPGLQLLERAQRSYQERMEKGQMAVQRRAWITALSEGTAAPVQVPNLILKKGESALLAVRATLFERKVVRREYVGGSRGTSIRIMKGVSFRVGASRVQLVSEEGNVPVSEGQLVITSRRVVFMGDHKSINDPLNRIVEAQPYLDSLQYSVEGRQRRRIIGFSPTEGEAVCAALNGAMKRDGLDE